jgi:DNA-binding response OmpR family regulator
MPDAKQPGHNGPSQAFNILSVSPLAEDHATLDCLLGDGDPDTGTNVHWQLWTASTLSSALRALRRIPCPVVVCERDLPLGDWRDLLEHTRHLTSPPLVIVTSLPADDSLWAEALNLGAYDVLAKPFDRIEVIRVITSACLRWCRDRAQPEGSGLLRRSAGAA